MSGGHADDLIRAGLRASTSHIKRDHRPAEVPVALWLPPEVRRAVKDEDEASPSRHLVIRNSRTLRAWLEAAGAAERERPER